MFTTICGGYIIVFTGQFSTSGGGYTDMSGNFIRTAPWLNSQRVRGYLFIAAAANIALIVWLLATARAGVDRNGFLIGTDFISFWTSGRMLLAGQNVYDMAAHIAAQQQYFKAADGFTAFFYPPTFLPFVAPLGALGYFPALAVWIALTGGLYLAAVRGWIGQVGAGAPLWLLALAFPPLAITITHGQTSFLLAALLGGGALLVRDRPVAAGICFGLATIKPQFGLLIPIVLLLTGQWRAIVSAGVTALALAAVSTLTFGADIWADWFAISDRASTAMATGAVGYGKMMSAFAGVKLLGGNTAAAYAVQAAVSLAVVATLIVVAFRRKYDLGIGALMLAGAPLATPFVLDYDMVILAFPLLWLAAQPDRDWQRIAILFAFAAPIFARPLALATSVPIMPFAMAVLFAVIARAILAERGSADAAPT